MRTFWLRSVFVSLLLIGCAHVPKKPPAGVKISDFRNAQKEVASKLARLAGTVAISFWGEKQSGAGYGQFIADFPQIYRTELRGPLGNLHFVFATRKNDFVVHYVKANTAYTDRHGGRRYLKWLLGMDLSFQEFHRLTLGELPEGWKIPSTWTWDDQEGYFVFEGAGMRFFSKDGRTLKRIEVDSQKGRFTIEYSDYRSCCGLDQPLAHAVAFENQSDGSGLKLRWKKLLPLKSPPNGQKLWPKLPEVPKVSLEG